MKTDLLNVYGCDFVQPDKTTIYVEVAAPNFGKAASIARASLSGNEFESYELKQIVFIRPVVVQSFKINKYAYKSTLQHK